MATRDDVILERDRVLPHTFIAAAADDPQAVAVQEVGAQGGRYTRQGFSELFLRWADAFRRHGLSSGQTVMTMLPNRAESYAIWLGAAWIKAIETPLNTQYRGAMLRYACNYSGAKLLVIDARYLGSLEQVAGELDHLKHVVVVDRDGPLPKLPFTVQTRDEFLDGAGLADDEPGPEYYDIACMVLTSGTTGPSKGVLMPWAELHEFTASTPDDLVGEGEGYYSYLPTFHAAGRLGVYIPALSRGRSVLREVFSATEFWSDIAQHECTATTVLGPLGKILLQMPEHEDEIGTPLDRVIMGPLIDELDAFRDRFGVKVSTAYAMTEIGSPFSSHGYELANTASCGRPRAGYELRIVNERDEPLGVGDVGELIVRHDYPWRLNAGYWKMPDKTAEAWRNGWFHTGDGFRRDEDGNYYFVDRIKDAIRRRGENISSFEVEAYVAEHPKVREVAAIGVPSEFGEEEVKVVVLPEGELTEAALIEWLAPRMPRFMVPRYVELVDHELPKTDTMRVQKVKLREDPLNADTWDREAAGIELPR